MNAPLGSEESAHPERVQDVAPPTAAFSWNATRMLTRSVTAFPEVL